MKYNPHDYQAYATEFILSHPVAAILLQMGLGKSEITLTAIRELLDRGEVRKVLVIAPLRVARDTWPEEICKWDHLWGITWSIAIGSPDERRKALCRFSKKRSVAKSVFRFLMRFSENLITIANFGNAW